jgi:hypothetical protein
MSFKSNFETKALGILADVTSKKQKLAAAPHDSSDEKAFSTAPGRTGDLQDRKWLTSKVAVLQAELEAATGQGIAISLSDLVEAPGRRRAPRHLASYAKTSARTTLLRLSPFGS